MLRFRRRREMAERFDDRWGDLARYNTEVHNGLMHTPAMVEAMAVKQAQYSEMQRRGLDLRYDPIPPVAP